MRGPGPTSRPSRARVRGATIAAFVALAPLLPAAAVAVETLKVDTALSYVCALPSGPQPATVRITAAFPERASVGGEIRPADVTTTVELPAAAVADLTALDAAEVRAETALGVAVGQNGQETQAAWRGTAQPAGVPAEGPLALTTTGDVPIVTASAPGDLVFTAGSLDIGLALSTADGTPAGPASLSVTCAPDGDAEEGGPLATVPVGPGPSTGEPGGSPSPSDPAPPSSPPAPGPEPSGSEDGGIPTRGLPQTGGAGPGTGKTPGSTRAAEGADGTGGAPEVAGTPSETSADRGPAPTCRQENPTPTTLVAYVTGYTNVRKLDGASLLPLSCMLIEQGNPVPPEHIPDGEFQFFTPSLADFSYQGRKQTPPFTSTFLTFGFQPVTATMVLEQTGPITIGTLFRVIFATNQNLMESTVRAPLVLRVLDVEVNGVKLDVGPSCRTVKPLSSYDPEAAEYPGDHLVMVGKGEMDLGGNATGYQLTTGGPLTGETTIPAFTGCGTGGENLDRLLTASISGPGNHVKQIQGQTCSAGLEDPPPNQCTEDRQPLVLPKPER
ncbi:DUF6801 domain-containing protein [Streptomyces sp. NPDC056528]|uniref:DUF6801 domain-containing protein n=1 Tax=Streptomyces sp. NPDC056528 TaxID=3345854 RepID=UPI0036CF9DA7